MAIPLSTSARLAGAKSITVEKKPPVLLMYMKSSGYAARTGSSDLESPVRELLLSTGLLLDPITVRVFNQTNFLSSPAFSGLQVVA